MTNEVYRPPEAELLLETDLRGDQFYVVSKLKLTLLFLATLGLYTIYWFYVNWRNYRDTTGNRVWPIPRAIFYIFFTHSLFKNVDATLRDQHYQYAWSPNLMATLFVFLSIISNVLDRLSFREIGSPLTDVLSLAILPFTLLVILKAQEAINISQSDREGSSNSRLTIYNYLWILLGSVLWLIIAVGLLDILGIISLES